MRIDRIVSSRHQKGRVLVFLASGALLKVTERELLDFGLRPGDDLDEAAIARLTSAAGASDVRDRAAALIGRRAMSRSDLEKKLLEKGASAEDAASAAGWLEDIGALDDADYAAMLVRHCGQMGYGPARQRAELQKHGIGRELWEDALAQAPDAAGLAERFLRERFRSGVSDEPARRRAAGALARRGFDWDTAREALRRVAEEEESETAD